MTTVVILGSTGSIGTQVIEVIGHHPDRYQVLGLAANGNVELAVEQAQALGVSWVAMADREAARRVREALEPGISVLDGPEGVIELASTEADVTVNGMVGSRGLAPTLAALQSGSRLALANKESLVVGGQLVLQARSYPEQIVPVDSEHSALAQCLRTGLVSEVERLIVTASGGPFRGMTRQELSQATLDQALAHPTWEMGPVITVNSATLANKGLEVIEAHLLFGIPYDRIEVVVHPQSLVHGMVEFIDGSTIAKLSPPDMRLPIQLALSWPSRIDSLAARMDWTRAHELTFEPLDRAAFPMVDLAVEAGREGGIFPAVFNAANEVAVDAFLSSRIRFLGIAEVVEAVLEETEAAATFDLDRVLAAEETARAHARRLLDQKET